VGGVRFRRGSGATAPPPEPQTRKVQNMRKIKMMLSVWCLVASGQWLVASVVLPTLGVRAPYVGGSGSLRWRFGLPTLEGRSPCVGAARGKQQAYNNKVLVARHVSGKAALLVWRRGWGEPSGRAVAARRDASPHLTSPHHAARSVIAPYLCVSGKTVLPLVNPFFTIPPERQAKAPAPPAANLRQA